ncbi:hypothetical protein A7J57_01075 [Agrobacterium tumefaciens]|uniref:Uncharacterized protein n=1 Tax=Agrobacterium tumefaciens TaxID=358 RepID=A0A176XHP2_AGRTU|nr:hypothetical protein A7J57_01075 [Agrobacterium tumefaciens]
MLGKIAFCPNLRGGCYAHDDGLSDPHLKPKHIVAKATAIRRPPGSFKRTATPAPIALAAKANQRRCCDVSKSITPSKMMTGRAGLR